MAQLVVAAAVSYGASVAATAAGYAASATFLGMTAAGWGWTVGSMIGGAMFGGGGGADGPRIDDRKVTSSVYGQQMPIVYGTIRCGTQILWSSDLIEQANEIGGKGGGDSVTMYSYSVNVIVSVCEAPAEPLRIWANGRLIWTADGGDGVVDEVIIQRGNIRILRGASDQEPDPVYEAAVTTADAVGYRGQLCIMFEGLQLQFAGNRLPSIEVEVATASDTQECAVDPFEAVEPSNADVFSANDLTFGMGNTATAYDADTGRFFILSRPNGGDSGIYPVLEVWSAAGSSDMSLYTSVSMPSSALPSGMGINPDTRKLWVFYGDVAPSTGAGPVAAIVDLDSLTVETSFVELINYLDAACGVYSWFEDNGTHGTNEGFTGALYGASPHFHGSITTYSWHGSGAASHVAYAIGPGDATGKISDGSSCTLATVGASNYVYVGGSAGTGGVGAVLYVPQNDTSLPSEQQWLGALNYRIYWDGGEIQKVEQTSATTVTSTEVGATGSTQSRLFWSQERRKVIAQRGSYIAAINLDASTGNADALDTQWTLSATLEDFGLVQSAAWSDYHDGLLVSNYSVFGTALAILDPETDEYLWGPCSYDNDVWNSYFTYGKFVGIREVGNGWFVALTEYGDKIVKFRAPGSTVIGGPVILGDIVEDLCVRSGLTEAQIDRTTLTDLVDGYKVARRTSARASIDVLRSAWPFDAVASGAVLKFVKRGLSPVATIDADDLGTRIYTQDGKPEPALQIERSARDEVPRELSLTYIDASADYDPGVATARRQVGGAPTIATAELAIVMSSDYAGRVAWYNLLLQHASGDRLKWGLPQSYEAIEPTDTVWMPDTDAVLRRVLVTNKTSSRPWIEFEGRFEDASIYEVLLGAPGRETGPGQDAPAAMYRVTLALLDLPPLRDVDDTLLLYVAAAPADGGTWSGATLYKSTDGGSNYSPALSLTTAATMGVTASTLGNWSGGNVFDDVNALTVVLDYGTLSSATELAVLNGANAAYVGGELIQFTTATLTGDRTWEISGLLRGRRGTEREILGHVYGEAFVLLEDSTLRLLALNYSDVGVQRHYKLVPPGGAISSAAVTAHTADGNSVKPLAPVGIAGTRDSGDLTITWVRRARVNAGWRDYIDVPVDEPTESYQIDILDGADVVRTLVSSTPTVEYTSAQQTTDFGSPQSVVSVAIYQISARLGRGHAGTATL